MSILFENKILLRYMNTTTNTIQDPVFNNVTPKIKSITIYYKYS